MTTRSPDAPRERYPLATGEAGAARLRLLHRVLGPSTMVVLHRAGLREGMQVADIGSGVGLVTAHLAWEVGENGSVVGVDISPEQIAVAAQTLAAEGLSNVRFVAADAYDTGLPRASFDLVYCRLLLCHLQRPREALREMVALLKPGGALLCEDTEAGTIQTLPPSEVYAAEPARIERVAGARGVDANIGPKLPGYLRELGLERIDVTLGQFAFLRGEAKRIWEYTLTEASPSLIEQGLMQREEIDAKLAAMREVNADERVLLVLPRWWQVWGYKPGSGHTRE